MAWRGLEAFNETLALVKCAQKAKISIKLN